MFVYAVTLIFPANIYQILLQINLKQHCKMFLMVNLLSFMIDCHLFYTSKRRGGGMKKNLWVFSFHHEIDARICMIPKFDRTQKKVTDIL